MIVFVVVCIFMVVFFLILFISIFWFVEIKLVDICNMVLWVDDLSIEDIVIVVIMNEMFVWFFFDFFFDWWFLSEYVFKEIENWDLKLVVLDIFFLKVIVLEDDVLLCSWLFLMFVFVVVVVNVGIFDVLR